jgi:N-acetyl sugar amidotransferase
MDSTDPQIVFDDSGVCNHCHAYGSAVASREAPEGEREARLHRLLERMKRDGRGRRYDCVIGISGGVDSTYAAYMSKQFGLRALAVHFDNGWNSELAVANIEKTLRSLGIELFTYVVEWEEFRALQVAFLRASIPNAEIPTDHAFQAVLYQVAAREQVKYIVRGDNAATESVLPEAWVYNNKDLRLIRGINRRFGRSRLRSFPEISLGKYAFYTYVSGIRQVYLLDYVRYDKAAAKQLIQEELGWRDYGGKHHESIYTMFFQSYILPRKFNIDKRRAHLSNLICSGQLTRDQALVQLSEPVFEPGKEGEYLEYVTTKLGLTPTEFEEIMRSPVRHVDEFPNNRWIFGLLRAVSRWMGDPRMARG